MIGLEEIEKKRLISPSSVGCAIFLASFQFQLILDMKLNALVRFNLGLRKSDCLFVYLSGEERMEETLNRASTQYLVESKAPAQAVQSN